MRGLSCCAYWDFYFFKLCTAENISFPSSSVTNLSIQIQKYVIIRRPITEAEQNSAPLNRKGK